MDIMVCITLPRSIYDFYHRASAFVADSSPEQIMADALTAYAGMLTQDLPQEGGPSPDSGSDS